LRGRGEEGIGEKKRRGFSPEERVRRGVARDIHLHHVCRPAHINRSTYLAGFGLTVLALLAGFLLHSKFMALGGPNHYGTPE